MGTKFQAPSQAPIRGAIQTGARAIAAPGYAARGSQIAAQKFAEAANKINMKGVHPAKRGSAYPPTTFMKK